MATCDIHNTDTWTRHARFRTQRRDSCCCCFRKYDGSWKAIAFGADCVDKGTEAYKDEHYPIDTSDITPLSMLEFLMEQHDRP